MSNRIQYVQRRLMELADIAEHRKLDEVEIREEKRLEEELKILSDRGY